jgi:anti-anti-sigma regulatory factor
MTETLLATIMRAQASFTVIDLTGINRMDARVADCVLQMVRAAGLLGCRCLVSGISPESAQTMVQLDRDPGGLHTFGTLRDALGYVLRVRGTGRERNNS